MLTPDSVECLSYDSFGMPRGPTSGSFSTLNTTEQPLMEMKLERSESPFSLYSYFFFYQDHSSVLSKSKSTSFQTHKWLLMKRMNNVLKNSWQLSSCSCWHVPFEMTLSGTCLVSIHFKNHTKWSKIQSDLCLR